MAQRQGVPMGLGLLVATRYATMMDRCIGEDGYECLGNVIRQNSNIVIHLKLLL